MRNAPSCAKALVGRDCRIPNLKSNTIGGLKEAGIEDFRWHDCLGSALIQRGASLYEVQKLMGHKSIATTQRYAHLAPENLKSAVSALDKKDPEKGSVTDLLQSQNQGLQRACKSLK